MNSIEERIEFPNYASACIAKHSRNITDCKHVGTTGASLLAFQCPAGRYHCEASSDFALRIVHDTGFTAELDIGVGTVSVNVAAGQLFLTPPFIATDNQFHRAGRGVVLALAHDKVSDLLQGIVSQPDTTLRELSMRPFRDDFIRTAVNQLRAVMHSQRHADTLFADAAVLAIWAMLAGRAEKKAFRAKHGLADWQMRRAMERLEAMQEISLAELAASANLSPFHFARAFKQTTGLAPHQYHLGLRMERAKDLLANTQLPITEVALSVGYGSSQTLARIFRKEVGTSPIDYRRSTTV